jgi:signal transduction histidine kinase
MNFFGISGLLIAGFTGLMSILMFAQKLKHTILWGFFSGCAGLWGVGTFFIAKSQDYDNAIIWWRMAYIGVILIPVFLNLFVHVFLKLERVFNKIQLYLVVFSGLVFLFLNIASDLFIKDIRYAFNQFYYIISPTPFYSLFVIFFFVVVLYSIAQLFFAYRKASDIFIKKRLQYIILGLIAGFIGGGLSFLPVYSIYIYPYTNSSIAVGVLIVGYAILKYRLMNIKIIATEIFAVIIPLVLLIDILAFTANQMVIYKLILLGLTVIFSVLLVRGVFKEVEAKEALMKLNQAKTEFLNIASHQLRTPVSVIKGTVSMMREGDLDKLPPEKKAVFMEGLWQKSKKLENIVSDILNASEMSSDKYRLIDKKAAPINVINMLKKVIEEAQFEAQEREIEVKLIEPERPLPLISGQEEYLKEAIGNLLDNAIKYTPSTAMNHETRDKRSTPGVVTLSVNQDGKDVIIQVRDNGIGIPYNEAKNLFRKFQRASNARNMYTDGSGLGLFIVKEIAEGHGGRVWFNSQMGQGTTFYVSLPIKPVSEPDIKKYILEKQTI